MARSNWTNWLCETTQLTEIGVVPTRAAAVTLSSTVASGLSGVTATSASRDPVRQSQDMQRDGLCIARFPCEFYFQHDALPAYPCDSR